MRSLRLALLILLFLLPTTLRAQPLASRVPADAVAYFGWKGAESAANGYAGSHLQAVIDASNFATFRDEFIPQLLQKATAKNGDNGDGARGIHTLLDIYWRHPTAFFFSGMTTGPDSKPIPRLGILCQAGDDANTLLTILNAAIQSDDPKAPAKAVESGNVIAFTFGFAENESPLPDDPNQAGDAADRPKALDSDADFARVAKQVTPDPFIIAYLDTTKLLALIDKAVDTNENEEAKSIWPKVREASGLLGLKHIMLAGGFAGRDWATQCFADAPAPRTGLLTLLEPKPVDPDLLARIPATAGFAQVGQFNVAGILTQTRAMMVAATPEGGTWFDKGMAVAQMMIGRNLKTDILEPLGTQWAVYNDSPPGTNPLFNTVVVNKPVNVDKAKTGWTMLTFALNNAGAGFIRQKGLPVTFKQSKVGDMTIYTIETPFGQPSWTASKGFMYFGLSPDAVTRATSVGPTTKPFASNDIYGSLQKKLAGDVIPSGFSFADLPATAAVLYPQIQAELDEANKLLDAQGLKLPEKLLPPLEKISAELAPSAQVSWADDAGFHMKGISPFPGSDLLSTAPTGGVGGFANLIAQTSKDVSRLLGPANSSKSAENMREIGHQLLIYAAKNNGKFPPDLATLVTQKLVKPEVLINPNSKLSPPANFAAMSVEDQTAWLGEHPSYVYAGAQLDMTTVNDTTTKAILRERDGEGSDGKVNVLFVDGHVVGQSEADARTAVGQ